jgi:hypothetical protein
VLVFLAAVAAMCAVAFVALDFFHVPAALHLHLYESTRFIDYLAACTAGAWLSRTAPWRSFGTGRGAVGAVATMLLVAVYFLWSHEDLIWDEDRFPEIYVRACLAVIALTGLVAGVAWRFGGEAAGEGRSMPVGAQLGAAAALVVLARLFVPTELQWRYDQLKGAAVTAWIAKNTPPDAIIAIPPRADFPLGALRYGARRHTFVNARDFGETSFSLGYFHTWVERMSALCGRDLSDPAAEPPVLDRVREGYMSTDTERVRGLKAKYGVSYVVAPMPLELPVVYEDEDFTVYRIDP